LRAFHRRPEENLKGFGPPRELTDVRLTIHQLPR